ncbi:hypothetical protein E2C01_079807 [Portunus trituberculatus]|uniref:Uncharacterized protein n=1 Tax=Portunus trituberculatus TaxID=210409 RepID=A0A5B7ISA6_PORTR|nr:hypothetical protein [Portunus trituberculatus]
MTPSVEKHFPASRITLRSLGCVRVSQFSPRYVKKLFVVLNSPVTFPLLHGG